MGAAVLPAPPAAPGNVGTGPGPGAGNTPSSGHGRASNAAGRLADSKGGGTVEASADSSKTDKAGAGGEQRPPWRTRAGAPTSLGIPDATLLLGSYMLFLF